MRIDDMVTYLENLDFKVTKRQSTWFKGYEFTIFKDDIESYGIYIPPKRYSNVTDVLNHQIEFLDDLISRWRYEAIRYRKVEVNNNMENKSSFPWAAGIWSNGILHIGGDTNARKYAVKITDIEMDKDETSFRATVLDPAARDYSPNDYAKYDTGIFENWLRQSPWAFSGRKNGKTLYLKQMMNAIYGAPLTIEKVIFNPPATIVLWSDGTKTVVKAQGYDEYDPEKGLAMAICKKVMGNKGNYNNEINKWTDKYWEKMKDDDKDYVWPLFTNPDYGNELMRATESIKKASENLNKLTSNVFGTDK